MAQVWEAMQTTTGRKVALKFVPVASSVAAKRAQREAQIVARLKHPNVVELHDAFAISSPCDAVVLVLERLSGQSLQDALKASGHLSFNVVADLGRCILQALALAHSEGIVHRDIKPSNIFISAGGGWHAKVLDFGVAKASYAFTGTVLQLTQRGAKPGTLAYMSPEQFLGETQITAAADVWATGVVLFEAMTGQHPFRSGDTSDLVRNVLLGNARALRPLMEAKHALVPAGIVDLVERMISLDVSRRPRDAGEALRLWIAALETPLLGQNHQDAAVAIGDVIEGRYEVTHMIGQGGMAMVVGAKHLRLGTPVAIKFSYAEIAASPVARERFLREAQAAASLKSPHVAKVSDFGILPDGTPFMVIEYLEGCDLSEQLKKSETPLLVEDVIDCVVEACDALAEAHARGIVHRDIKPSNLFLTKDARGLTTLKVLDFGIATAPTSSSGVLTQTTEAFGSPHYMSPEQIRGAKLVDARSDVWALGVVMYELLTAQHPFVGEHPAAVVASIIADEAPPITSVRAVPLPVENILAACLSKAPAHRPQTVEELAVLLAPFGGERSRAVVARFAPSLAPLSHRAGAAAVTPSLTPGSLAPRSLSTADEATQPTPSPIRQGWLLAAAVLLVLFAAGVWGAHLFTTSAVPVVDVPPALVLLVPPPPEPVLPVALLAEPAPQVAPPLPDASTPVVVHRAQPRPGNAKPPETGQPTVPAQPKPPVVKVPQNGTVRGGGSFD